MPGLTNLREMVMRGAIDCRLQFWIHQTQALWTSWSITMPN